MPLPTDEQVLKLRSGVFARATRLRDVLHSCQVLHENDLILLHQLYLLAKDDSPRRLTSSELEIFRLLSFIPPSTVENQAPCLDEETRGIVVNSLVGTHFTDLELCYPIHSSHPQSHVAKLYAAMPKCTLPGYLPEELVGPRINPLESQDEILLSDSPVEKIPEDMPLSIELHIVPADETFSHELVAMDDTLLVDLEEQDDDDDDDDDAATYEYPRPDEEE